MEADRPAVYRPRRPRASPLWQCVSRHLPELRRLRPRSLIAYNALALPLAAVGWIGPWEAALGMGASSMAVLLNALRPFYPSRSWKASTFSFRSRSPSYS